MRKIPVKNYFILFAIVLATIIISILLFGNYSKKQEQTSKMYEFIPEVKEADLPDYLKEKSRVLIYVADKYDLSISKMEDKLISQIKEHSLIETVVYLDTSDLDERALNEFINKYDYDINFKNIPLMIIFMDNKIESVIYIDENNFDLESVIKIEDIK